MEDTEPAEDGVLAGLRWNRGARDQTQLKHKIRDLPGLLKHGLHLRKKSVSVSDAPSFRVCVDVSNGLSFEPAALSTRAASQSRHDSGVFILLQSQKPPSFIHMYVLLRMLRICWAPYLYSPVVKATPPPYTS